MARYIAARSPAPPAALLSSDALALIQGDTLLAPFWKETKPAWLEKVDPKDLYDPTGSTNYIEASLHVHAGNEMVVVKKDGSGDPQATIYELDPSADRIIPPASFAIIKSWEYFDIPPFLAGLLVTPVRTAMYAMSNISTMLDPLFKGFLIINILNPSPWPYVLRRGYLLSRTVFYMVAHIDAPRAMPDAYPGSHEGQMSLEAIVKNRLRYEGILYSPLVKDALTRDWLRG